MACSFEFSDFHIYFFLVFSVSNRKWEVWESYDFPIKKFPLNTNPSLINLMIYKIVTCLKIRKSKNWVSTS